jgi:hypothetical protein
MECDITEAGALVIKCASRAEYEGVTAWWRKALLNVNEVVVEEPGGLRTKVPRVINADRISIK